LNRSSARLAVNPYVLVTIDRVEELFAIARPEDRKSSLAIMSLMTAEHMPFVVLMTLRSDHLDHRHRTVVR
jgi:hypothetical protein